VPRVSVFSPLVLCGKKLEDWGTVISMDWSLVVDSIRDLVVGILSGFGRRDSFRVLEGSTPLNTKP
jgi:hypothetical protein